MNVTPHQLEWATKAIVIAILVSGDAIERGPGFTVEDRVKAAAILADQIIDAGRPAGNPAKRDEP